jgi:DNA-binding MarR family transcriptional regulator
LTGQLLVEEEIMSLKEMSQLLYSIKLIDQKITTLFETKTGISLTRYELLMSLKENQPCLQTAIQEQLKIDHGAITRHLKILEEKQYVQRQRNPENNREILVTLTDKALNELTRCEHEHCDLEQVIQPEFTQADRQQLRALLEKLDKNIK